MKCKLSEWKKIYDTVTINMQKKSVYDQGGRKIEGRFQKTSGKTGRLVYDTVSDRCDSAGRSNRVRSVWTLVCCGPCIAQIQQIIYSFYIVLKIFDKS